MEKPARLTYSNKNQARGERFELIHSEERSVVKLYFILAVLALAFLSWIVHDAPPLALDLAAGRAVQSVQAGWYDILMRSVGSPGYPPQVYALVFWIIIVLYLTGLKWEAVCEVFATVGIGAVGYLVKILVDRPRPTPDLVNVLTELDGGKLSFPAGHVQSFVAIIGFLWVLAFLYSKNPWVRALSLLVFGEMLALIGISRIYTGEHWLTDVIGAYLLGSIWLLATLRLYEWGKPRFFSERRNGTGTTRGAD